MPNVCQKGKRVERDIANWLKERGCPSAHRSAQHCGIPTDASTGLTDNSDITVPNELPNWHIESKGTKSPKLPPSKLKQWCKQIREDCPAGRLAVIITIANGYPPVALLTADTYTAVALQVSALTVNVDNSFSPAIELYKLEKGARIYATLMDKVPKPFAGAVAYEVDLDTILIAVYADLWLKWALEYESKLKQMKETLKREIKLEIVK